MSERTKSNTETNSSWTRRDTWTAVGIASVVLGLTAAVVTPVAIITNRNADRNTRMIHELESRTKDDGFNSSIDWDSLYQGRATGSLVVNQNCTIHDVRIKFTEQDGHIVDATSYEVDGYSYPSVSERYNAAVHREQHDVHGVATTFSWINQADLEQHVLGPEPCQTLAGNLDIQGQVAAN